MDAGLKAICAVWFETWWGPSRFKRRIAGGKGIFIVVDNQPGQTEQPGAKRPCSWLNPVKLPPSLD